MATPVPAVPRLTYLRIKNYRALRDVEFRDLTPLTVLIGPNGSGKSTVLDALDFLAEAVRGNLTKAWEKRDRFQGMRTRGEKKGISFEFKVKLSQAGAVFHYYFEVDEQKGMVIVKDEWLKVEPKASKTYNEENVLFAIVKQLKNGRNAIRLKRQKALASKTEALYYDSSNDIEGITFALDNSILSLSDLLKFAYFIQVKSLKKLIEFYRLFHLTDDHLKGYSDAGPREKLSPNGDNLPNVLYYLHERHPEVLAKITAQMRRWVPGLADIVPEITSDERLLLRFKDAPFEKPLPAQYMSSGTMRLAALLTLLYEPDATGLLGMEEPDNELHPLLLYRLAEELGKASETRQLLVTTHSPMLLDALDPAQVWILHRGTDGYTKATRTADIPNVPELVEDGSPLGYLWTSNAFTVGNPLASFHPRPDAR